MGCRRASSLPRHGYLRRSENVVGLRIDRRRSGVGLKLLFCLRRPIPFRMGWRVGLASESSGCERRAVLRRGAERLPSPIFDFFVRGVALCDVVFHVGRRFVREVATPAECPRDACLRSGDPSKKWGHTGWIRKNCVLLHLLSRERKLSKKSIAIVLILKFRQNKVKEERASALSFYLYVSKVFSRLRHIGWRESYTSKTHSLTGVWRHHSIDGKST